MIRRDEDAKRNLVGFAVMFAGAFIGWGVVGVLVLRHVLLSSFYRGRWPEEVLTGIAGIALGGGSWLVVAVAVYRLLLRRL